MGLFKRLPVALLKRAVEAETAEARALATMSIGREIRTAAMTPEDRRFARALFMRISHDVSEEVRRALAVTLRNSPNLPRDVANRLIADIDSIASPVLESSPVITDEDLIVVLRSRAAAKVRAIASRNSVSERVSGAVISFGDGHAVAQLAANDGALISSEDAARIVRLAASDDLIREAALRRQDMPAELVVKLIDRHVTRAKAKLAPHTDQATIIARGTGSRATASFATREWAPCAVEAYVDALADSQGLTDDVLARAAGQGDWRFVQTALARLSGISVEKAALMVLDPKPYALTALTQRAGLSGAASALLVVAASAYLDLSNRAVTLDRRAFQRMMAERTATHPDSAVHEALWLDWLDEGLSLKVA